jgi:Ketopantoate reductase PanE/ApbA
MTVLIVGSGVIGPVYGSHLAAVGHAVSVLRHPPRTDQVAATGLRARDVLDGGLIEIAARGGPAGLPRIILPSQPHCRASFRYAGPHGRSGIHTAGAVSISAVTAR